MDADAALERDRRPRLLIVEDNPGVRRSMQLLFHGQGFDVRAYGSGEALLADARAEDPACVVADYRMQGLDGIALLDALRARGWNGPAVLVTGFRSPDIVARATAAGYGAVFEKPLRERSLVEAVLRMVSARSQA